MCRLIIAAALALGTAPAGAATIVATYTGLASGMDRPGIFGVPGAVANAPFRARFGYDPARNPAGLKLGPTFAQHDGFDALAPIEGEIMIGGVTLDLRPDNGGRPFSYYAAARRTDEHGPGRIDEIFHHITQRSSRGRQTHITILTLGIGSAVHDITAGVDLTAPITYSFQPGDYRLGNFVRFGKAGAGLIQPDFAFDLRPQNLQVSVAAVPEPATWAMMIAGFAFTGTMLRRTRRSSAAFA
jgi:hypothetical protein